MCQNILHQLKVRVFCFYMCEKTVNVLKMHYSEVIKIMEGMSGV